MKVLGLAAFLLAPAILFGQLGSGTVTVTASNNSNPQPDQAVFAISVSSGADRSLVDIVKALSGTGISAPNLTGLSLADPMPAAGVRIPTPGTFGPPPLSWTFRLVVPITEIKNTTASLSSLAKTITQNNSGLTLSFNLQSTQVSPQLMRNCDFGSLMNNARAEAQSIAGATSSPGAVVGIFGSVAQSTIGCSVTATFGLPVSRSGPNTITISASRTASSPADQVAIGLDVISGQTAGLDDINGALAAAGITGATFTGVVTSFATGSSPCAPCSRTGPDWSFTLTTPFAKLSSTLTQLATAEETIAKQNASLDLSFYIRGLQVSQQSQPACDEAGLVSDARLLAQTLAAAAGVGVGAILNMSDQPISIPTAAYRSGDFSILAARILTATLPPTVSCTLSVQFQLL